MQCLLWLYSLILEKQVLLQLLHVKATANSMDAGATLLSALLLQVFLSLLFHLNASFDSKPPTDAICYVSLTGCWVNEWYLHVGFANFIHYINYIHFSLLIIRFNEIII